jgi:hypothetical protein
MYQKLSLKTAVVTLTMTAIWAAPSSAEESAAELFAMSNNSAAETIVRETSMGDALAARIRLALNNMSAAERTQFFEADMTTRLDILQTRRQLDMGDSAAETASKN